MNVGRTRHAARGVYGWVVAGVIALTAGTALADDPPRPWLAQQPTPAPAPAAAPEPSRMPWRASLMIGASAALGAAAMWARSRKGGGLAKLTSSRELRVISTVRVGPKGHLVLAGIGDRALLLGVTDNSVRRIAWLPAEKIAAPEAVSTADGMHTAEAASTAMVPVGSGGASLESGPAPARQAPSRISSAGKGAFADILRKIGGRHVDAPPPDANDTSPAATLAGLRKDSVQWSKGAIGASASSGASSHASRPESNLAGSGGELEQQAAGILKRRSRGRRA